mmetsp:Transcript_2495/g.3597  ORF Transcript_2495/g.3597 Transcript_2495/m.3597 type:complete len:653 (-) Transcript_2495:176-2134(-)
MSDEEVECRSPLTDGNFWAMEDEDDDIPLPKTPKASKKVEEPPPVVDEDDDNDGDTRASSQVFSDDFWNSGVENDEEDKKVEESKNSYMVEAPQKRDSLRAARPRKSRGSKGTRNDRKSSASATLPPVIEEGNGSAKKAAFGNSFWTGYSEHDTERKKPQRNDKKAFEAFEEEGEGEGRKERSESMVFESSFWESEGAENVARTLPSIPKAASTSTQETSPSKSMKTNNDTKASPTKLNPISERPSRLSHITSESMMTAPVAPLDSSNAGLPKMTSTMQSVKSDCSIVPPPPILDEGLDEDVADRDLPAAPTTEDNPPPPPMQEDIDEPPPPPPDDDDEDEPPPPPSTSMKNVYKAQREVTGPVSFSSVFSNMSLKSSEAKGTTKSKAFTGGEKLPMGWQGYLPRSEEKKLPAVPDLTKNGDSSEIMVQCQELLAAISQARIFTANIQVTVRRLQDFMKKSGGLSEAISNVAIMQAMEIRADEWNEIDKLLEGTKIAEFRARIQTAIANSLKRSPSEISQTQLNLLLDVGKRYDLAYLPTMINVGGGPPPTPSFKYLYWSTRSAYEQQNKIIPEERNSLMQYLTTNSVFTGPVQVTESALRKCVKVVVYSVPGVTLSVKIADVLKKVCTNICQFADVEALTIAMTKMIKKGF